MLRDYQQRAIEQLYEWFEEEPNGNPCLELPTGSGKSHFVAALCKDAIANWPTTRILMLTHVKELIRQNAEKMLEHWPEAPLGIYSAGLKRRELGSQITFAGIQSVRKRAKDIGHIDLVVIDECHLVSHKQEGGYRSLVTDLLEINPNLRVVGLTATPYRMGHGLITRKGALFNGLIQPTNIGELLSKKHLAPLRSKNTEVRISVDGVRKRGGDYREDDLAAAVEKFDTPSAVRETIRRAEERRSILFFCTGVKHAKDVRDLVLEHGITAETVLGDTPPEERKRILEGFKSGEIRVVTNANVLTTGFDHPNLDCIVFMRPTLSVSLYVQMAGRGMRIKDHADDCLLLDFAGLILKHGPVADVNPGKPAGANGLPPVKICRYCQEFNALAALKCSACGKPFPERRQKPLILHDDDIMLRVEKAEISASKSEMNVKRWTWRVHTGRSSGAKMLMVSYHGTLAQEPINEYLTIANSGWSGNKARLTLGAMARKAGVAAHMSMSFEEIAIAMTNGSPPDIIRHKKDGRFYRVTERVWHEDGARGAAGAGAMVQANLRAGSDLRHT